MSLSRFTLRMSSAFSCSWPECSGKAPCRFKGSAGGDGSAALTWQPAPGAASASSSTKGAPPSKSSTIGSTRLAARAGDDEDLASEFSSGSSAMLRRSLGGGGLVLKTTLKASVVPSRFCKSTTLLIELVPWTYLREMRHNSISREHLIVSVESISIIWVPILCLFLFLFLVWSQYQTRLGMLFYILSRLGRIRWGLAFYPVSYHALTVSAEAWHFILYLITPLQYPSRLYLITPWQYPPRLYLITP